VLLPADAVSGTASAAASATPRSIALARGLRSVVMTSCEPGCIEGTSKGLTNLHVKSSGSCSTGQRETNVSAGLGQYWRSRNELAQDRTGVHKTAPAPVALVHRVVTNAPTRLPRTIDVVLRYQKTAKSELPDRSGGGRNRPADQGERRLRDDLVSVHQG